jgi:DNA processing protein
MKERLDRLALSLLLGEEPLALRKLLAAFTTPTGVLDARAGGRLTTEAIVAARAEAEREYESAAASGIRIIGEDDPEYPPLLLRIRDRPLVLYLKGRSDPRDLLAIVGARRADAHGKRLAERVGRDLAEAGLGIVSGLAWGIDAAAHRGALEGKGYTIAILGSGLERIYPRDHGPLAERIANEGGLLISEYPLAAAPEKQRFPLRNRIIAGMTLGTVVIQAGPRSGSLITARLAAEYDRLLWVTPNRAGDPLSEGVTALLRTGAMAAGSAEDVIEDLAPIRGGRRGGAPARDAAADPIAQALGADGATFDEIAARLSMPREELHAELLRRQLKGRVVLEHGGIYRLTGF